MTQPNALFLADILEDGGKPADIAEKAAAELRRLHAELERCKQVCAATAEGWRSDAALAEPVLQTCNCLWDGEMQMQQCTLHEAHVDAIKEWAQRAKFAEKKLAALAEQRLTDMEQKMERSIESLKTALAEPVPTPKHATVAEWWADKQRKPLTREEAIALWADKSDGPSNSEIVLFARAIERAHGIGDSDE